MVDTDHTGIIKALDAAKFLKKSGLSDVVLSHVSNKTLIRITLFYLKNLSNRFGIYQIQTETVIWTN